MHLSLVHTCQYKNRGFSPRVCEYVDKLGQILDCFCNRIEFTQSEEAIPHSHDKCEPGFMVKRLLS